MLRSALDPAYFVMVFTSLLAIVNPLSAVPLFVAATADYERERRRATLRTAILTATMVLLAFGVLGTWILGFFGITTYAFRIAGGILFLGIGTDMLQARESRERSSRVEKAEASQRQDIGIIPLGLPTLAGPGSITTIITLAAQAQTPAQHATIYGSVIAVMAVCWLVLGMAPQLVRILGRTGLNVMTRLMGLLVMVVGVQLIIDGITAVVREMGTK